MPERLSLWLFFPFEVPEDVVLCRLIYIYRMGVGVFKGPHGRGRVCKWLAPAGHQSAADNREVLVQLYPFFRPVKAPLLLLVEHAREYHVGVVV